MIASPALKQWIERSGPQRSSIGGAPHGMSGSMRHHGGAQPPLVRLTAALDALAVPTAHEVEALPALCALFDDTQWLDDWFEAMAASARSDAFFQPPLPTLKNGFQSGLQLFSHRYLRLSLGVLPIDALSAKKTGRTGAAAIVFTGTLSLQKFLRAGEAVLRMWAAAEANPAFRFAQMPCCRPQETRRLRDGDLLRLDGRRQSYVVEHATGDIVLLQCEILVEPAALLVEYDAEVHDAVAVSSTDDGASRSQMLLSFLGSVGCPDRESVIEAYTASPHFFVRWHAMREMLRLDSGTALPRLAIMAQTDPHADVREAAAGVLAAIDVQKARGASPCRA